MSLSNALLIPGLDSPLNQIRQLLFGQGQRGWMGIPSYSPAMISGNTFGAGVQNFLDLSGYNNNATQGTPASRAAWGRVPKTGRRNLLVNTAFTGTVPGSPGTRPTSWNEGATTGSIASYDVAAEEIGFSATSARRFIEQTITVPINSTYTFSTEISVTVPSTILSFFCNSNDPVSGATRAFRLNGVTAVLGDTVPVGTHTIELIITTTSTAWTSGYRIGVGCRTGDVTGAAIFRRPQAEVGLARSTFQAVTTAFDVTEAGQRDCYYLQSDGIDDGYVTGSNVDLSGTDKVTVFAAVRKLSDAAAGTIVELSPIWASNNGSFSLQSAFGVGDNFASTSRGDAAFNSNQAAIATGIASPATCILSAIFDISGDINQLRINGVVSASTNGDQGAGNFRSDLLYLFRRAGTTVPFNGQCFALIVAGGSYSLSTIQRIERILSRYTPGVSL